MKIKHEKLPIKYLLNIFKEIKEYPTHTDLTYILLSNLSDRDEIYESFTPSKVWPYMKDTMGTIKDLVGFLEYVSNPEECSSAFLCKIGLTEGKKTEQQYQVINNPWA